MKLIKRYRGTLVAVAMGMWLFSAYSYAASDKDREVTLVIPAGVVQEFINEALPAELTDHDKLSGILRITSVENLKLGLNKVWFTATIHGENIAYEGKISGLPANLRFGALDGTFHCETSIRYDADKRLLCLRPKVTEEAEKGNLLGLLVSLLSGKEYPVEIGKIKPIETRVSGKTLGIDLDISNIYTADNRLFVALRPRVRTGKE
jgi:hypothetical protein